MSSPLADWEQEQEANFPLTPVQRRYLEVFDEWLGAAEGERARHAGRRRNLVELMRHDGVQ
jgi:hypothetical protein